MGRDKNLMAALLNVRKALGEEIAGLGRSLDDSRREVLERIDAEAAELRADGRETRDRAHRGATAAAETERTVSQLRQEVREVRESIAGLQQTLDALARHPLFGTATTEAPEPLDEGEAPGWTEPEPVDAGQEPPFPPLAEGGGQEPGPPEDAVPGATPALDPLRGRRGRRPHQPRNPGRHRPRRAAAEGGQGRDGGPGLPSRVMGVLRHLRR
ncbi:hypothetical protein GTY89_19015 [Streptomyces sp. SID5471]|uniref:hypothetical protein n=1 Tax=Streptomyces sp. SID5471 TaxID=2690298 RepID=UPI0002AC89BD|nr:hypothetical protein [Streptomyces sp. SID5471]